MVPVNSSASDEPTTHRAEFGSRVRNRYVEQLIGMSYVIAAPSEENDLSMTLASFRNLCLSRDKFAIRYRNFRLQRKEYGR